MSSLAKLMENLTAGRALMLEEGEIMGGVEPKHWPDDQWENVLGDHLVHDQRAKAMLFLLVNGTDPLKVIKWFLEGPNGYLEKPKSWVDVRDIFFKFCSGYFDFYNVYLVEPVAIKHQLKLQKRILDKPWTPEDEYVLPSIMKTQVGYLRRGIIGLEFDMDKPIHECFNINHVAVPVDWADPKSKIVTEVFSTFTMEWHFKQAIQCAFDLSRVWSANMKTMRTLYEGMLVEAFKDPPIRNLGGNMERKKALGGPLLVDLPKPVPKPLELAGSSSENWNLPDDYLMTVEDMDDFLPDA